MKNKESAGSACFSQHDGEDPMRHEGTIFCQRKWVIFFH